MTTTEAVMNQQTPNNIRVTWTPSQPEPQKCPHCGYCPRCGRANTLPYYPQPYPWPMTPAPWSPPFTVTCGAGGTVTSGAGGGGGIGQPNIVGMWFNAAQ